MVMKELLSASATKLYLISFVQTLGVQTLDHLRARISNWPPSEGTGRKTKKATRILAFPLSLLFTYHFLLFSCFLPEGWLSLFAPPPATQGGERGRERENLKQDPCPAWPRSQSHDPEIMIQDKINSQLFNRLS